MKIRPAHLVGMALVACVGLLPPTPAQGDSIAISFGKAPSAFTPGLNSTRGWQFTVDSMPIAVTALGLWDHDADGLDNRHRVGIWDESSNLLASAIMPAGTVASLEGTDDFRFVSLATAVVLNPGTYRIGAEYVDGDLDRIASFTGPVSASGISYVRALLSPSGTGFADPVNGSAVVEGSFGPNFRFSVVPEPSSLTLVLGAVSLVGVYGGRQMRRRRRLAG